MAWVRMDDAMPDSDKTFDLSDAAFRLMVESWCRSSRKAQDGVLTPKDVRHLTRRLNAREAKDAIAELVGGDRPLWHDLAKWSKHACGSCVNLRAKKRVTDPIPDTGYLIHDFLVLNPAAWEVEAKRQMRADAGRMGAEARWGNGKPDSGSHDDTHGESYSGSDGTSHSTPHGSENAPDRMARTPVPRTPILLEERRGAGGGLRPVRELVDEATKHLPRDAS